MVAEAWHAGWGGQRERPGAVAAHYALTGLAEGAWVSFSGEGTLACFINTECKTGLNAV